VPFGESLTATVARRNIARMAQQFIVGQTPAEAVDGLHRLWRLGSAHTVDLLGEKTVVEAEADRYAARVVELMTTLSSAFMSSKRARTVLSISLAVGCRETVSGLRRDARESADVLRVFGPFDALHPPRS